MSNNTNIFDDAPVISAYSTEQAIADGVLVHFEAITPGKWCVTDGIWHAICDKTGEGRTPAQALANLMQDALMFIKTHKDEVIRQANKGDMPQFFDDFSEHMDGNITGERLWIAGNETGGFTVMFPHER